MKLSQFKFKLPLDQVALYPHSVEHTIERSDGTKQTFCVTRRDEARLMVLHKKSGEIEMFKKDADGNPIEGEFLEFRNVIDYFDEGDTFVFNDTKVSPVRLYGTKEIKDGSNTCTLAVVVMQSYTLDSSIKKKGWVQNFTVNNPAGSSGKEHYAFSKAVDKVIGHIAGLKTDDNTRYWIMGQSRGGALANILSAKLPDKTGISRKNIFAYTFESPATVDGSVFSSSSENISKYGYIHNYRCTDDIITYLPPWEMTRYGEEYRA